MSTQLRRAAADYLALRRAVGFKLRGHDRLLADFIDHLERAGIVHVTTAEAVAWATASSDVSSVRWAQRLGVVRGFARHLRCVDPATEVPPADAVLSRPCRPAARLFSDDDVAGILAAAGALRPALRAVTYRTLFGLLAVTGMRVGEAMNLDRAHVDLDAGVISIDETKFRKHRRVPVHDTTVVALADYATVRDGSFPGRAGPFFVSTRGTRLQHPCVHETFRRLADSTGLDKPEQERARVHGFRHSFAVATLTDWYRDGEDAAVRLPVLSAYLGHADPASTYWYLQATPDLLAAARDRLDAWEQRQ